MKFSETSQTQHTKSVAGISLYCPLSAKQQNSELEKHPHGLVALKCDSVSHELPVWLYPANIPKAQARHS